MVWDACSPFAERDACGIGFLAELDRGPAHEVIEDGLTLLERLEHRGACGCDGETGDGAGILIQIPDAFFRGWMSAHGHRLPAPGAYGVGMMFLPQDSVLRHENKRLVERSLHLHGLTALAWREVPTDVSVLGVAAAETEPFVAQCIVTPVESSADTDASDVVLNTDTSRELDQKLYLARREMERAVAEHLTEADADFHVASLSSRTLVYKGMLTAGQLRDYYPDLSDDATRSAFAVVHARFSTNTLPRWSLAQPFRRLCHNGEINTLRGNVNRLRAREYRFADSFSSREDDPFVESLAELGAGLDLSASDSCILDNTTEMLHHAGRSLPHVLRMLIPPAWEQDTTLPDEARAFYQYHACLSEPWDGPAAVAFADGRHVGAMLDRNGLRPARYTITSGGRVVLASEAGVLDVDASAVVTQGRLGPGDMLVADTATGTVQSGAELIAELATSTPYQTWVDTHLRTETDVRGGTLEKELSEWKNGQRPALTNGSQTNGAKRKGRSAENQPAPSVEPSETLDPDSLRKLQRAFGYSKEDLRILLSPMAEGGKTPIGSMGDDTPLAVLADRPRLLYDHFRQLFAQVTNPPIDAIREEQVTSLTTYLGAEGSLLDETPAQARRLRLDGPILDTAMLNSLAAWDAPGFQVARLDITGPVDTPTAQVLDRLCQHASEAPAEGATLLVLSDRATGPDRRPLPAVLATAAVHQHLIRTGDRTRCSLLVDSFEPRETHHMCCLLGFGADAIHPRGAIATIRHLADVQTIEASPEAAFGSYRTALHKGILKVMSKMGISTLQSYQGAQIFEAVGLGASVIDAHFTHTPSELGGFGIETIDKRSRERHAAGFARSTTSLDSGGRYQWRRDGEPHALSPRAIAKLQHATRPANGATNGASPRSFAHGHAGGDGQPVSSRDSAFDEHSLDAGRDKYQAFADEINRTGADAHDLRGLLGFIDADSPLVALDDVEPWTEIVRRFKTGAMSYGAISDETHRTLAEAMNRLGGKSNTGEGGEHPERYPDQHPARSRIKQVASGRFGVTLPYLASADEIQIKMAQGAKPGEGGQLPGEKVYPWIAEVRHSTPGVPLISPPPHHDIYSIEDLAQLIFDLKNAAPEARISVKLVSAAGVGTIAAGVAKARADHILISGHSGGTGASPQTSIMHAGMPWETGIADAHQMLVKQGLRNRVSLEADGGLRTGRDVAIAALLGAQEFGFSTAPLISIGCIMMRKCHLNTCPVGIATQDPELREKFEGTPEQIINYFYFVAQEVRQIMARLGYRTLDEMVGRTDRLRPFPESAARGLTLAPLLRRPAPPPVLRSFAEATEQDHNLDAALDHDLIARAEPVLSADTRDAAEPLTLNVLITNQNRTLGTMLSRAVVDRFGAGGLPDGTLTLRCDGTAGQSFAAFGAPGITFDVRGAANDYLGKGLSGAKVMIRPHENAGYAPEDSTVIGNVALYGATSGQLFVRGQAGERFAVRNSGATAVVEGVGDHGCEYMTGGCVVVLGPTGTNFAAGMSGGVAYVYDPDDRFAARCNREMVELTQVDLGSDDAIRLRALLEAHTEATESTIARKLLDRGAASMANFVRVLPLPFKEAIREGEATMPSFG